MRADIADAEQVFKACEGSVLFAGGNDAFCDVCAAQNMDEFFVRGGIGVNGTTGNLGLFVGRSDRCRSWRRGLDLWGRNCWSGRGSWLLPCRRRLLVEDVAACWLRLQERWFVGHWLWGKSRGRSI